MKPNRTNSTKSPDPEATGRDAVHRKSVFRTIEQADFSPEHVVRQRTRTVFQSSVRASIERASVIYENETSSTSNNGDNSDSSDSETDSPVSSSASSKDLQTISSESLYSKLSTSDETHEIRDFVEAYGGDTDTDGPGYMPPPDLPPHMIIGMEEDSVHEWRDPALMWEREYLFDEENVFKQGWLVKEGRIHKNWKKRWFILRGAKLAYHTAQTRKLKGTLDLETCLVRQGTRPNMLELVTEGRKLYFAAESERETQEWLLAIQNKIAAIEYVKKTRYLKLQPHPKITAFLNRPDASRLCFCDEDVRVEALVAVAQPLRYHAHIHTIELRNANLDNVCCSLICAALHASNTLRLLDISHNNISDARDIASMLKKNTSLQCLILDHNPLGDAGVSAVVQAAADHVPALEICTLDATECGPEGAAAVAEVLPNWPALAVLALSKNRIGWRGALSIGKALARRECRVGVVSLGQNALGNDGVIALCENGLGNVRVLDLSLNDIGFPGVHALCQRLSKIQTLMLGGNRISEQMLTELLAAAGWTFPEIQLSV